MDLQQAYLLNELALHRMSASCPCLSPNYLAMQHIIQSSRIQTSAPSSHQPDLLLPSQQNLWVLVIQGKDLQQWEYLFAIECRPWELGFPTERQSFTTGVKLVTEQNSGVTVYFIKNTVNYFTQLCNIPNRFKSSTPHTRLIFSSLNLKHRKLANIQI